MGNTYNPCTNCNTNQHSFNWFNIDGLPCEPCSDDFVCKYNFPAKCVIVSVALDNIGSDANDNVEHILQLIDALVASSMNITFAGQDTSTIHWTPGGSAGHQPSAAVKVSATAGNVVTINSDGIFVPTPVFVEQFKVKVDNADTPDFLEAQIIGDHDINSYLTIQVNKVAGQLKIKPVFDINALANAICLLCNTTVDPDVTVSCGAIQLFGTTGGVFTLGTPASVILKIPVTVTGSGTVTITVTVGNGSFFGSVSQILNPGTTLVTCPVFYNGLGSSGTQTMVVTFTGTSNDVPPCNVNVTVNGAVSCIPVTFAGSPNLPEATVGVLYDYSIFLNGTSPFGITNIVKPGWMTIALVGGSVHITGTPSSGDIATGVTAGFRVTNCTSDHSDFSDTLNVISEDSSIFNNSAVNFGSYDIYVDGNPVQSGALNTTITDNFTYGDVLTDVDVIVVINYGVPGANPFTTATLTSNSVSFSGTFNTNGTVITFSNVDVVGGIDIVITGVAVPDCTSYTIETVSSVSVAWFNCIDAAPLTGTFFGPTSICAQTGTANITSGSGSIIAAGVCAP